MSVITFSGQVAWHSPHCTQASSAKRSIGRSGSSSSAPVGQADTQARQSVQPSTLTSTVPNGAPCGSAMTSTGAGAARCSSRKRKPHHVALAADGPRSSPAAARRRRGVDRAQRLAERIGIVGLDRGDAARAEAEPGKDRLGQRQRPASSPATSWRGFARSRNRTRRRAIGEGRGDRLEADLRHLVDRERQHVRRQPVAEARQRIDQRRAVRLVVQQHDRLRAAGLAIGRQQRAQACASAYRPAAAHRRPRRSGRPPRIGRSRRRYARRSRRDRRRA